MKQRTPNPVLVLDHWVVGAVEDSLGTAPPHVLNECMRIAWSDPEEGRCTRRMRCLGFLHRQPVHGL